MSGLVDVAEGNDSTPETPKVFEFLWRQGYTDRGEVELRPTCHRVCLDRLETTIGYLRRALHGASLWRGVRDLLIFWSTVSERTFHGVGCSEVTGIWRYRHCQGYLHGESWRPA